MTSVVTALGAAAIDNMPMLINLIAGLVHKHAPAAEAANGSGTGPVKFADVFTAVMTALARAHAAGSIAAVPPDDFVKVVIQAVVSSMNLLGQLSGPETQVADGRTQAKAVTLRAGETLTVIAGV